MRFVSFASSSKGNCALVSYKNTNILVDCGISRKRIVNYLSEYGLTLKDIDCILLTHSHTDHTSGLPMVLKYDDMKIMGLKETLTSVVDMLERTGVKANLSNFKIVHPLNVLNENVYIKIKDISVFPLKGCHDVPSLFYKFILGEQKIAILTDMGRYNEYVIRSLNDVDYMMLECNYDEDMLMDSDRTEELKARIAGPGGHLSNKECCEIIDELSKHNLKEVYLSHISDETNSEDYAYEYVSRYFQDKNAPIIKVTKRLELTEFLNS